jgi:hypothetical protein
MSPSNPKETCGCCGAEPPARSDALTGVALPPIHAMVAVVAKADLPAGREPLHVAVSEKNVEFATVPVCDPCHRDPSRRPAGFKAHFFPRQMAKLATHMAGSDGIGGG